MASSDKDVKLLFFDTFYHDQNKEELNLDLIQFSRPVVVYEVRVIPLKTQVEPNLGKGYRLGGTLPSTFKLDVFVNNLEKPNAATFESLGQLDYEENKNIQLKPGHEVPTDGLILKGWYRTVTLAVYGWVTVVKVPQNSPPPPPPPLPTHQTPQSKTKIPGLDISDDDTHKPAVQQHPLDFINEQVQKRQQQQLSSGSSTTASSSTRDPHKPASLEDAFEEVLRKPSPRRDRGSSRDRASSRDLDRGSSRDRASSHDSHERDRDRDSHERHRDYSFPPEPKEPYDTREKEARDEQDRSRSREQERDYVTRGSRDEDRPRSREQDRERDYGGRRERPGRHGSRDSDGRDSRGLSQSRENSREPRDYKNDDDDLERERARDEHYLEKDKELEREKERLREHGDVDREGREIETLEDERREKEQRERESKEREKEKELQRERVREKELQRERELKEKEREREFEKERERELKEKEIEMEREREKDKELERERDREKDVRGKDRYDYDRQPSTRTPPKRGSVGRSRSRSGSRTRKRSRSRSRSKQIPSRARQRSRSRTPEVERPPEPPLSGDEEEDDEMGDDEEEIEDQEMYQTVPERPSRRHRRAICDADSQDVEGEYEDISSDEEMGALEVPNILQVDFYDLDEESWGGPQTFNPMDFYLNPILALKSPSLSTYEMEASKYSLKSEAEFEKPREAQMLMDIISKFSDPDAEHHDRWVLAMEEIPSLVDKGLSYLLEHEERHNVLDTLVEWVMKGCDPDIAMTQPDAAIKVRHLKVGIKLAGCLCATSENIARALLRQGIQAKLMSLFESQFIVFTVKHLALRSLAKTVHFPLGIQWFLGTHPDMSESDKEPTCYQRLVKSLLQPKIVKLTMSVTALLRKIHLYESLTNLSDVTDFVVTSTPALDEEQMQKEEEEEEDPPHMKEEDENKILANLEEAVEILGSPHKLIGQEHNAVPYNLLVDNTVKSSATIQSVYKFSDSCGLLESLFMLLSCPATVSSPSVYLAVHTLLQQFISTQEGLLHLCSHPDATNGILRCLLQMVEEPDESGEDIPSRQLGLELVYHLQVIQCVDQLLHCQNKGSKTIEDTEAITALHSLYTMINSGASRDPLMGRNIMAKVLGLDSNIEVLLPYLEKTGEEEHDSQLRKSVCANYAIQLLLTVVKTSTDVKMLERYSQRLSALCQDGTSTKLTQLQEWLAPARKVTSFDLDGLPSMITQLKLYTDDVKKVPPGLITTVRMIYRLIVDAATNASVDNSESLNEAKYRYVLVELYSTECFPIFINILQKLSESQLKVWQQGIPYTTDQWLTYFSLIKPTLSLVHATLCQLIQAFQVEAKEGAKTEAVGDAPGGEEKDSEPLTINSFKDLTSIPVLLELHTVMCSVPTSSLYSSDLAKIQKDIVDTILAFTQEDLQQTQTDDALSKSLWTLMLKELLKYTIKSPYTYMSGLLILSELLPLPFPLHTKDPLSDEEMDAAIMARKLWSVHLQSATPELFAVLDTLSGTGCQPLQHLMRRVCWQIADLAAPSSLRVTKILLDILMVNLKPKKPTQTAEGEKREGEEEMTAVRTVSIHTAKTLNLLAYLLSHPGIKAALLQLIGTSIHSDAKYNDFLPIMLQLLNQAAETPAEIQAQEGIVSMIQNLCDLEISMVNTDLPVTLAEHLANSLPESVLMADIMSALLEHIGNTSQSYASILPCLRTLIMLTDHDYGFFHLKMNLRRNIATIHTLLNQINNTFSKDSSDCLSTLSAVLELLRLMTTIELGEELAVTRTKIISHEELRQFLLWSPDVRHPLEELEELSREEETLETILESITVLTTVLRGTSDTPQEGDTNLEEILLPIPASLTDLFNQRAVYTILDSEDERLSPSYWLANPAADEPDAEPEVLRCDLQAICEHHLPDFNLEEELKKEATSAEEDIVRPKRPKDRRKSHEVININRGKTRKPFVAPMRGRGIMSHSMSGRSNDLFRTRTPNTSRPPSMHVDDFVKMENSQQQHEQQQQPLRQPIAPPIGPGGRDSREKELPRGRGGFDRGRGFGMPPPGRFFTPPGSYRRDPIMHDPHPPPPGPHPSHRGASRGGLLPMDRSRPNFMAPRPFSRGPDRQGPPPMDRHGGRNGRFSPGGRGGRGQWGRGRDMGEHGRFAGGFRGRRDPGRHVRSFTK